MMQDVEKVLLLMYEGWSQVPLIDSIYDFIYIVVFLRWNDTVHNLFHIGIRALLPSAVGFSRYR